jgi:predicted O-linked N-acetylglucosamine transferase (SPINDLY family)
MPTATEFYETGLALHKQGDLEAAAARYDAALSRDARHAPSLHMRGVIHLQQRNHAEAASLIARALAVNPKDAAAQGNLVAALLPLNRFDEAIEAARKAAALNPNSADIWGNLGTALSRRDRYAEAAEAYRRAIALRPDRAGLHSGYGVALGRLERFEEALDSHHRALELAPGRPEFLNNMSITLRGMNLNAEAETVLRSAVAGGLDDPEFRASLGMLLYRRGKSAEAVELLDKATREHGLSRLDSTVMFIRNYSDANSIEGQLAQAIRSAQDVSRRVVRDAEHPNDADPDRVLRVGLVSSDFRRHVVALFLIGVLRQIDPARIALFIYSGRDMDDDVFNVEFRSFLPNWRNIFGVSPEGVAARVRADAVDILIDLAGPTSESRLPVFAIKPAPVQVEWLGYSGTSGLDTIDYILGDAEVLPEGVHQSIETPWRLPDAYLCYSPQPEAPPIRPLPALTNGYVTFGTLNNNRKLSSSTFDVWAGILASVPDSRFHIKTRLGEDTPEDRARLVGEFTSRGIAAERITVLGYIEGWMQHFAFYNDFDIALDPFPYNGTTTTCDALYMAVPVVALRGDRFISRVTASILHTTGLDDWIADDLDTYVSKAVAFASDIPALSRLRQTLRHRFVTSPMCDAPRFARNFEAALRGMWRIWCDKHRGS